MNLFLKLKHKFSNYRIKSKIITVLWITFIWTLISLFRFFETYTSIISTEGQEFPVKLSEGIIANLLVIVPAGIIIGTSLVFIWERWLRKMVYIKAMFFILLFYSLVFFIFFPVNYLMQVINNSNLLIDDDLLKTVFIGVFNYALLSNYIYWFVITFLTILFLLIRDKFGPITFVNFFKRKIP
jgi:adenylate cyclase